MAHFEFRLPDVGEGTTEAEIAAWHVTVGARITEDEPLVDVMTDKASVEITSPVTGKILALHGDAGSRVSVGAILVEIQIDKNDAAEISPRSAATSNGSSVRPPAATEQAPVTATSRFSHASATNAPLASPSTRRKARELGITLDELTGTGPGGRITESDVDKRMAQNVRSRPGASSRADAITETKIIGVRRKIAEKMAESTQRIPHFTYVEELDLTDLEKFRKDLNNDRADKPKLTLLPFFMRALVKLVREFPTVNSQYDDEAQILRSYAPLHIGIATQTSSGLMVPVVRHVERLNLWECAREVGRLSAAARDGTATRNELSGSTITLTSLGALGGITATPIINHPEVAIIGPNKLVERPAVVNGNIVIRTMMNLSSSFDHRIIDGFEAARFVQAFKRLTETPALLFLDPA